MYGFSNYRRNINKLFLALLVLPILLHSDYLKELKSLSVEQKKVMVQAYKIGQMFDLELTLIAITWKESDFGKYPLNLQSMDCGVTQINIYWYLKNHKLKTNYYNKSKFCAKLIKDNRLALFSAIDILLHFKKVHKGNWRKMVGSYNGGNKPNMKYAKDIAKRIQAIKQFVKGG
jgi:hypothetical protein